MGLEVSFEGAFVRQDLTSDGSEFHVCGAATGKDRRANSVCVFGTISSGASDDRRGRTGTAVWINVKLRPRYSFLNKIILYCIV